MLLGGQASAKPLVLQLPKAGNTPAEYEDAGFVQRSLAGFRLALADGASSTIYARTWARMLVCSFAKNPFWAVPALRVRARELGECWRQLFSRVALPWYAERKMAQGSAATLIGVCISYSAQLNGAGKWKALSVGDSCLFVMRGSKLLQMHPDLQPAQFGNTPDLIYSHHAHNLRLAQGRLYAEGEWLRGDTFVLASDALAKWIRQDVDSGQDGWRRLGGLAATPNPRHAFSSWALQEQDAGRLKNDDLTLVFYET